MDHMQDMRGQPATKEDIESLRLDDIAASLGEQIRRLEQLMAVVRTMARKLGMDWQDVIDRTEKAMWADQERERLRRESKGG